jgi:hypothetical protein
MSSAVSSVSMSLVISKLDTSSLGVWSVAGLNGVCSRPADLARSIADVLWHTVLQGTFDGTGCRAHRGLEPVVS